MSSVYQPPRSGQNNVGEYLASGLPFVTSSTATVAPTQIDFPFLTNEMYFGCSGSSGAIRVGFTAQGVQGSNYFVISSDGTGYQGPYRLRCKTIFIRAHNGTPAYTVTAGLTGIPITSFPVLTGSAADPTTGQPLYLTGSYVNQFGYKGLSF
jgi:hypothetical protein